MQHTHGAHAIRALPPIPLTEPQPGDLPGWTGEPIPAPDPRTAVHRCLTHPASQRDSDHHQRVRALQAKLQQDYRRRLKWMAAMWVAAAAIGLFVGIAAASYLAIPDATRIAARTVTR